MAKPTRDQIMQRAQAARQALARHELVNAAALLLPVMPHARDLPEVAVLYAGIRGRQGHYPDAIDWYRAALKHLHSNDDLRRSLVLVLKRAGRHEEALAQIARLRETDPWNVPTVTLQIGTLAELNRKADARALLAELRAHHTPATLSSSDLARVCIQILRLEPDPETIEQSIALAQAAGLEPQIKSMLLQHAGGALQRAGQHERAFEMLARAKQARGLRFDAQAEDRAVSEAIAFWTSPAADDLPRATFDGSGLLYIVGMPRSGTSLLEQMLGRLPGVAPLGECSEVLRLAHALSPTELLAPGSIAKRLPLMTTENLDKLAARVLDGYKQLADPGPLRLMIDKMVFNFRHLPFMARALPGAKVLHIHRHPCDVALSCFTQPFNREHHFTADMDSLGRYYAQYQRLIDAWRALTPPRQRPEMLDVRYETLVAEPEATMRAVLQFLGLAWDPAVLNPEASERVVMTASRDQVRRPISTSAVGKWKPYEHHLAPFIQAIGGLPEEQPT